ncbi:hypothetical protein B0H13DRAFT_2313605 [Mycena leptocephala]|nr:hypothetical protein B0H13DRAFT_2313605 [Mycena leptocephala]
MYRTATALSGAGLCCSDSLPGFLCAGHAHTGKFLCRVLVRQLACAVDIPARCWQGIYSPREGEAGVLVMMAGAWDASENAQGRLYAVEGDEMARDWWCAWRLSEELRAMWMSLGAMRCLGSMAGLRCEAARLDACDGVESAVHASIHR